MNETKKHLKSVASNVDFLFMIIAQKKIYEKKSERKQTHEAETLFNEFFSLFAIDGNVFFICLLDRKIAFDVCKSSRRFWIKIDRKLLNLFVFINELDVSLNIFIQNI